MMQSCHVDAVRRSALSWMKRLGWNYLLPDQVLCLRGDPARLILGDRLIPALQRFTYAWNGRHLRLSEAAMGHILEHANAFHAVDHRSDSSAAVLALMLQGVPSCIDLPDGNRVTVRVPLIDWDHPHRNHWDVADDLRRSGTSRDPGIRDLIGYVNGLPLVLIACVERGTRGQWGPVEAGIQHLLRLTGRYGGDRSPDHAQVLVSLARGGGLYGGFSSPAHGWTRWREPSDSTPDWRALRAVLPRDLNGPADGPLATHAELLIGLLEPSRLLGFLRGYCDGAGGPPYRIARAAQFFACQAALRHLHRIVRSRARNDGQVFLAPGTGMNQARIWLLRAIARDPVLAGLRILIPLNGRHLPDIASARTVTEVQRHLQQHAPPPLHMPLKILHGWARSADADLTSGTALVMLVDAMFWNQRPAQLKRLRDRLPEASWLTLATTSLMPDAACRPGPVLYHYPPAHAVADRVTAPVWYDAAPVPAPDGAHTRTAHIVTLIQQHVVRNQGLPRQDVRAELRVATVECAQRYHEAFQQEGQLLTALRGAGGAAGPRSAGDRCARKPVDLVISLSSLPHGPDGRVGVLYLDGPVVSAELARLIGQLNQRAPDKPHALLVDFTEGGHASTFAHEASGYPTPLEDSGQDVQRGWTLLHAAIPAASDLATCRARLAPHWVLNAYGDDRDLHHRGRQLFRSRITRLGLALQVGASACSAAEAARHAAHHPALQRFSLLCDAVCRDALEEEALTQDDVRVRHWARDVTRELQEPSVPYDVAGLQAEDAGTPLAQANRLYTRLLRRLEEPADEPELQETARGALRQLLADHPEPQSRLTALHAFASRIPDLLGRAAPHPVSRGFLLVKGIAGHHLREHRLAALGKRVDQVVASGRTLIPERMDLFHAHVRVQLQDLLEKEVGEEAAHLVLDALLARSPHWGASG
jgi:hypothetical protein